MRYQLLYSLEYDLSPFHDALAAERINVRPVASPEELAPQTERTTFLLSPESRAMFNLAELRRFVEAGGAIVALGRPGERDVPPELPSELLTLFLREPVGPQQLLLAIRAGWRSTDIERLFEGFISTTVTLMEQRDPTEFGHAGRVARMTVSLAQAVNQVTHGPLRHLHFSPDQIREIHYASLLHDIGNIGVRENVLVKSKKLYPPDLSLIEQRYAFVRRTAERNLYKQRAEYLEQHGHQGYEAFLEGMRREYDDNIKALDRFMSLVLDCNEPTVLPDGTFNELLRYADHYYQDLDDNDQPFLTSDEVRYLTIRKGILDETERLEIESHVNHTYRFLMQIPWTNELQDIPRIAYGHHEKLNGVGYPRGVRGDDIPIQTRMMTIADIFDALTASDRPYKRAVPTESALNILSSEVKDGMLDADLFKLFVEAKVFEDT